VDGKKKTPVAPTPRMGDPGRGRKEKKMFEHLGGHPLTEGNLGRVWNPPGDSSLSAEEKKEITFKGRGKIPQAKGGKKF